jgi:hypothetical protein
MIEGYLIKFRNYLWVVKGCEHFDDYVIAYPRYDIINHSKIKSLSRALDIARRFGVLRYNECLKLEVPLLRRDEVEEVFDPFNREFWPKLPQEVDLILGGLKPGELSEVGLTGSYLVSVLLDGIKPRDVDLIVRGRVVGSKVYRRLKELREGGVSRPLEVVDEFEGCDPKTRATLLRNRVLEGVIGTTVYSIRIVSCRESVRPTCVEGYEFFSGELVIVEDISSYIMPYTYVAECDFGRVLVRSLRMRYSEIPVGTKLLVLNCRLEKYSDGSECISLDSCYTSISSTTLDRSLS